MHPLRSFKRLAEIKSRGYDFPCIEQNSFRSSSLLFFRLRIEVHTKLMFYEGLVTLLWATCKWVHLSSELFRGRMSGSHWPSPSPRSKHWLTHLRMGEKIPNCVHFLLGLSEQSSIVMNCNQLMDCLIRRTALRHADRHSTRWSSYLLRFHRRSFVHRSCYTSSVSEDSRRVGDGLWQRTMRRRTTELIRPVVIFSIWSANHRQKPTWEYRSVDSVGVPSPDESAMISSVVQALDCRQGGDCQSGDAIRDCITSPER